MIKEKIKNDIKQNIADADIQLSTNDNKYFNAIIITNTFEDKSLIDRQKIIHDIIGKYIINKEIHAISFKTYTKNEWIDKN